MKRAYEMKLGTGWLLSGNPSTSIVIGQAGPLLSGRPILEAELQETGD